jgi:hypothetical protein
MKEPTLEDDARDRLGDAVEDMQERGKETMKQHGELGGTTNNEELSPDKTRDVLMSDPEEAEKALEHMRERAVDRKREADQSLDRKREIVGE